MLLCSFRGSLRAAPLVLVFLLGSACGPDPSRTPPVTVSSETLGEGRPAREACRTNDNCTDTHPFCDVASGDCLAPCGTGWALRLECADFIEICDLDSGQCRSLCSDDSDCPSERPTCDLVTGDCISL